MLNKKVRGATIVEYDGIKFRSKFELSCYKKLQESHLKFSYEPDKFILWEGCKLCKIRVYAPKKTGVGRYGKELLDQSRALLNMTYTPDFKVEKDNYLIYFDVKGKENDTYGIKKKMFLKLLDNLETDKSIIFFEPHNVKQMIDAIKLIEEL